MKAPEAPPADGRARGHSVRGDKDTSPPAGFLWLPLNGSPSASFSSLACLTVRVLHVTSHRSAPPYLTWSPGKCLLLGTKLALSHGLCPSCMHWVLGSGQACEMAQKPPGAPPTSEPVGPPSLCRFPETRWPGNKKGHL